MSNYPFEPGKQVPYEPYQSTEPYTPPPPPPPYQPANPYASPPIYQPTDPYAPSSQPPPYQPTYPYIVPPPVKPRGRRNRTLFIGIASIVALLVVIGFIAVLATRGATGVASTPTPTSPPVHYPSVASAYSGTAHNASYNSDANIAMTSVVQDKEKINGDMLVGLPLVGSGPFTGTVSSSGAVRFALTSKDNGSTSITFSGFITAEGSMSGTYTVTSNGQKGTWKATPAADPVVYPTLSHNYSGNYNNAATGKSGSLSLQIVTQNQQNFNGVADNALTVNGTVGSDNSIQFTGTDSKGATIKFTGTVNIDGSLSGTYTASVGGMGTWKVSPA